jgi:hypothetical protein
MTELPRVSFIEGPTVVLPRSSGLFRGYNRYQFALDCFGMTSLALVVVYLLIPEGSRLSNTQDGMLANVLSEMVGIWIAVRLIGFFILQSDRRDRIRVRTVRSMRFFEAQIKHVIAADFSIGPVQRLRDELKWSTNLRADRERYLSEDEIKDVRRYYDLVSQFAEREGHGSSDELVNQIMHARVAAEQNILEETQEDYGMA